MNPLNLKFVFFGTPYVARDTLEILATHGYIPSLIVTAPDRPRGRGLVLTPSETKEWAVAHDIPYLTPEKITDEVVEMLAAYEAAYAICVAYGKILPSSLINLFPKGILNIHYSLLPKYRGASPVEAALLHGDTITGVSIQQMVPELDAGDIIASVEVPILPTETTKELRPRLVSIGAELLADTLPAFEADSVTRVPQDPSGVSVCKKIRKEEGLLDLQEDAALNWNKYRAYAESPGTYFFAQKGDTQIRVKIISATYEHNTFTPERVIPEGKSEQLFSDLKRSLS